VPRPRSDNTGRTRAPVNDLSRIISEREFDLLLGWIDPAKVTHGALMTVAAIDTTFDMAVGCAADIIPLPLDESRTGHLRKAVHAED
jgi:hypothetical protein